MNWLSKLERRYGRWALPNLTLYLILLQVTGAVVLMSGWGDASSFYLSGKMIYSGEWERLFSFMMLPKSLQPIWLLIALYVFYLMGTALERQWGAFKYNMFILSGYLLTVIGAFLFPNGWMTNFYFLGSVLLAFATIFPNFEFLLFFIIPCKVKYLGWIAAGSYILSFLGVFGGYLGDRVAIGAALLNYALFFGGDVIRNIKAARRRKEFIAENLEAEAVPMHQCATCGATDKADPNIAFRYCSTCAECFCEEHISEHTH